MKFIWAALMMGLYSILSIKLAFHPLTGMIILAVIIVGISLGDKYYSGNRVEKYSLIGSVILIEMFGVYYINYFLNLRDNAFIKWQIGILLFLTVFMTNLFKFRNNIFIEDVKEIGLLSILFFAFLGSIYRFNRDILELKDIFIIPIAIFIFTTVLIKIVRRYFFKELGKKVLIIGTGEKGYQLREILKNNSSTMLEFKGFLSLDSDIYENIERDQILENIELENDDTTHKNWIEKIKNEKIDEIIIALPEAKESIINHLIHNLDGIVRKIRYSPKVNGVFAFNTRVEDFDGSLLITAADNLISPYQMLWKRAFDITGATVGIIILAPIYFWVKRKIEIEDRGPIFFAHERIGMNLKTFKMLKFRSMYTDAQERLEKMLEDPEIAKEFYTNFKLKEDPRVTKIGNFLRKTSLDEFPQFINVLKGEMSLVGPRPVIQKEVDMYYGTELGKKIFLMKPGITGMWQSHGRSDIEDYNERIKLDLYYLRNWSIFMDIQILFRTIKNVIGRKGAY